MSEDHCCIETHVEALHLIATLKDPCFINDDHIRDAGTQLRAAVDDMEGKYLLINFKSIQMISSSMIGLLVQLQNDKCASAGVTLQICCLPEGVAEAIGMMNLNQLLNVFDTQEAALASAGV